MLRSLPTSMVTQRMITSMKTKSHTTTTKVRARATMARARMAAMGTMLTGSNNSSIMMAVTRNGARTTTICGDLVGIVLLKNLPCHAPRCKKRSGWPLSSDGDGAADKQILPYKKIISAYEHGVCGMRVTGLAAGRDIGRPRFFIFNP